MLISICICVVHLSILTICIQSGTNYVWFTVSGSSLAKCSHCHKQFLLRMTRSRYMGESLVCGDKHHDEIMMK